MHAATTQNLSVTQIKFPEIKLHTRDAHKLRGYFGNVFKDHSPLLHNHYDSGKLRYRYPLVQYKIIKEVPTLVAMDEGAEALTELFLKMKEINIDGTRYIINNKYIAAENCEIGISTALHTYHFETLWMALNQENHKLYMKGNKEEQSRILNNIIVGNILSFYKCANLILAPEERVMASVNVVSKPTKFKDQSMIAFSGSFVSNALLPDMIGLGKSVSRGFGTIRKY